MEVLQADGGIKRLLHHGSRNLLVVITESLVLGQFSVAVDGSVTEINRVCKSMICNNSSSSSSSLGFKHNFVIDFVSSKEKILICGKHGVYYQ